MGLIASLHIINTGHEMRFISSPDENLGRAALVLLCLHLLGKSLPLSCSVPLHLSTNLKCKVNIPL